jgi:uncharacterized membrane protein
MFVQNVLQRLRLQASDERLRRSVLDSGGNEASSTIKAYSTTTLALVRLTPYSSVRRRGVLGALLIASLSLVEVLVPSSGVGSLILLAAVMLSFLGVVILYPAIRDLSWILRNPSIYRNFEFGIILSYVGGFAVTIFVGYYSFSASGGGLESLAIANVLYYFVAIADALLLLRSLNMISAPTKVDVFRFSGIAFFVSALIPAALGIAILVDVRNIAILVSYAFLAVAFLEQPDPSIVATSRSPVTFPLQRHSDGEVGLPLGEYYVGGFTSAFLTRNGRGYGIYATNKRLFGVTNRYAVYTEPLRAVFGRPYGKSIAELERKHDFQLTGDDITKIEVRQPGLLFSGKLFITPRSGKKIKIDIRGQKELDEVMVIVKAFAPDFVSTNYTGS